MGWNLKGMPYLISNYPAYKKMDGGTYAMNVPHVVYTMKADGSYDVARQSWTATSMENFLSPGVAFFTQTATLNKTENLHFAQLLFDEGLSSSANTRSAITISLASADVTDADASGSVGVSTAATMMLPKNLPKFMN